MSRKSLDRNYITMAPEAKVRAFGRLVAEEDPNLSEYYIGRERYVDRALDVDDPATFFLGPKGAGKSAVLQMCRLTIGIDNPRLVSISPDDLAFSALANVEAT